MGPADLFGRGPVGSRVSLDEMVDRWWPVSGSPIFLKPTDAPKENGKTTVRARRGLYISDSGPIEKVVIDWDWLNLDDRRPISPDKKAKRPLMLGRAEMTRLEFHPRHS